MDIKKLAIDLADRVEKRPLSWLPTGECLTFGFTPEEKSLVICALRAYVQRAPKLQAGVPDETNIPGDKATDALSGDGSVDR